MCACECLKYNAEPLKMVLLTEEISQVKPEEKWPGQSCRIPRAPDFNVVGDLIVPAFGGQYEQRKFRKLEDRLHI